MSADPPRSRRRGTPISDGLGADLHALGGLLASHTRGLDDYLNRQAQRLDDRQHNLLAESAALMTPSDLHFDQLSKAELQALCRQHHLRGWSRLRHPQLLAFVKQHLEPSPAPAGVTDANDANDANHANDASRSERLLLLLLDHLGVAPEAVQAAWRGYDNTNNANNINNTSGNGNGS
jgi:hypothetical protein